MAVNRPRIRSVHDDGGRIAVVEDLVFYQRWGRTGFDLDRDLIRMPGIEIL